MSRWVLVVDDDELVLQITSEMLSDLGCNVLQAQSGSEALELLRRRPEIEILITDVNMPGMDGYQVADRACELRRDLQVILLSGRETDSHGFPMISKPFLQRDLTRVMRATTGLC